ncbi:MAG: prepilin-type N-terminal cleavage/methylation domain-containing protein [Desulfobacteraceae bacterium]|nr:prepilin-type N-terminal cleavage/methylation domain-containing protein [Desulfobacteraceae bacterium]
MKNNQKGFTLIELMIAVAIIGILAAIAVPQFMTYRMRSINTKAESTVGVFKSVEAALYQDIAGYGISFSGNNTVSAATAGSTGEGGEIDADTLGAQVAASTTQNGAGIRGSGSVTNGAVGCAVPNGVYTKTDTDTANAAYTSTAFCRGGNRAFQIDSDSESTILYVQDDTWASLPAPAVFGAKMSIPSDATAGSVENLGLDGGGDSSINGGLWTAVK